MQSLEDRIEELERLILVQQHELHKLEDRVFDLEAES